MAMKTEGSAAAGADEKHSGDSPSRTQTSFLARLERAAGDVADHRDAYRAAVELRDQLVIEAHDTHAMTTTAIARAAGIVQSRVVAILAKS